MICQTALMLAMGPTDGWRPSSAGYEDSAAVPVRCHYEKEEQAGRCATILEAAADAWAAQVDGVGFAAPMPDSDGIVDIYITDDGTGGGAYTTGSWTDEDPDDGRAACAGWIALDPTVPRKELAAYVAHEFNHVLQMATDFREPSLPLWEGCAEAAEEWTYPGDVTYTEWLIDFQETPWLGVLGDGYLLWDDYHLWSYYEYGATMWIRQLDAAWGDGEGGGAAALWEAAVQPGMENEPDVLDAWEALSGDWEDALLEFTVERARVGTDAAPEWSVPLGGAPIAIVLEEELDATELPTTVVPEVSPYQTGVVYVGLTGVTVGRTIEVSLAATDPSTRWGWVVVDGDADDRGTGASFAFAAETEAPVLGIVNLGTAEFDGDDTIAPSPVEITVAWADDEVADTGGESDPDGRRRGKNGEGCGCRAMGGGPAGLGVALVLAGRRRRPR